MKVKDMLKVARNWRDQQNVRAKQHVTFSEDRTIIHNLVDDLIYIPTPTFQVFHNEETFIKLIMGPYGSGKSTGCIHHIIQQAAKMPYWSNGRRKSRWAIVRNTSGELHSTTLQTWLTWFGELGDITKRQKPLLTYEHMFNDGKGIIELELIFIALDREQDIRKIKSLEVTGAYINELSEVPQGALSHFKGRVNHRYPSRSFCSEYYWSGIIADTNPPDVDHWIYKDFECQNLESYKIFHQPPGLLEEIPNSGRWTQNANCDNARNLAADYYLKLAEGQSRDFIKVYCLGEYGAVSYGKRVYPEFNDDLHSVDVLDPIEGLPIDLGWDFGLTPCCIVTQFSKRGQLRVLKEYTSEDMGIRTFVNSIVKPALAQDFPGFKVRWSRADPAGEAKDQIMEELSCIGELNDCGIITEAAITNQIEPRITSVTYFLTTLVDGKPAFLLSKYGCPQLRRGFLKDYCYKRVSVSGEERYKEEPHKNASSHPHDGLQYIALEFASDRISRQRLMEQKKEFDVYNPSVDFI